jgi:hypothetical protein
MDGDMLREIRCLWDLFEELSHYIPEAPAFSTSPRVQPAGAKDRMNLILKWVLGNGYLNPKSQL